MLPTAKITVATCRTHGREFTMIILQLAELKDNFEHFWMESSYNLDCLALNLLGFDGGILPWIPEKSFLL
jgi:hypothetical protein